MADKGWVLAGHLRAGDILVMLNGEHVVLELVQHELLESPVTTYNFEVEDFHTYHVGDNDILVHNKCFRGDLMDATGWTKEMAKGYDAHHVFPQEFRGKFKDIAGGNDWIDNPLYGSWWELHDHRSNAKMYNQAWKNFFNATEHATFDDVLEFGRTLADSFGIKISF